MRSIVVTGVSSGIGYATAARAIERGAQVFGSVRRPEDAARLSAEWGERFTALIFDVRDEDAVMAQSARVAEALDGRRLDGLVCNAGIGIPGPILYQPLDELREQLEVDLFSVFLLTQAFGPLLGADPMRRGKPGRLVLMSSIGGFLGQPFASAYIASKHGIEGFADSVRRELMLFGIGVILVAPSTVATPIWNKIDRLLGRYRDTPYEDAFDKGIRTMVDNGRHHGLAPEKVAEVVWQALTDARPRLRYAPAAHPVLEQALPKIAPRGVVDRVVGRFLGLRRQRAHSH
jgi:NAD(P)-dependent dehydrogenase (short-subunit alcohol dehydrogenase family)